MLKEEDVSKARNEFCAYLPSFDGKLVIVSNEVGHSVVPPTKLGRMFQSDQGTSEPKTGKHCRSRRHGHRWPANAFERYTTRGYVLNDHYLIRHGPTHLKSMVGWSDVPADLSDTAGITRLRTYLPDTGKVLSSDLKRARDTADALNLGQHRLPDDSNLREINFGDWELKPFAEIDKTDHDRVFAFYDNPGETSAPNGESWNGFCQRTDRAIDRLMSKYPEQPLIIVVHFGVIVSQIQRAESGGGNMRCDTR